MSNPTHGTKVTDPNAPSIQESTGPIASDSLAAQSSTFKSSNDTVPLSVSGSNSTFANTDTSGATTLNAVSSASARDNDSQYTTQSKATAVTDTTGSYSTGGDTATAGTAPSYVNSQNAGIEQKPKGGEEGDFSSGMKNASFGTDIGGRGDPGRVAVAGFAADKSKGSSGLAGVPTQKGGLGENSFEELGRETEA